MTVMYLVKYIDLSIMVFDCINVSPPPPQQQISITSTFSALKI